MSILLLYFLWTVWRYFRRIVKRFQLQPTSVVSGAFNNDQAAQGAPEPTADQIAREQQACHVCIIRTRTASIRLALYPLPPVPAAPTPRPTTQPTLPDGEGGSIYSSIVHIHRPIHRPLQEREEQLKLQQQYASLPESVKASMGIASPCGDPGPSSGAGGMH